MIRNFYLLIVVAVRLTALYLIASGLSLWALALLPASHLGLPFMALVIPVVKGILLWVLAKPCAELITRDLE